MTLILFLVDHVEQKCLEQQRYIPVLSLEDTINLRLSLVLPEQKIVIKLIFNFLLISILSCVSYMDRIQEFKFQSSFTFGKFEQVVTVFQNMVNRTCNQFKDHLGCHRHAIMLT